MTVTINNRTSTVTIARQGTQGPPGGGVGSPSIRSASGSAGGGSTYVYMGNAASGTLDSAGAWTITRLTVDGGGGLTATTHATSNPSSVWNDYASLTYT